MLIPDIELKNISRYRAEQMGAAMLFVILFHVALDRGDPFYGLRRCGNAVARYGYEYLACDGMEHEEGC